MANGVTITPRTKKDGSKAWGLMVRKKGQYFPKPL
jgi:hypothetical protein